MGIIRKKRILADATCDFCGQSQGTTLLKESEYANWLKHTTDLLTFDVEGKPMLLCWDCMVNLGKAREYDRRLNDLTYPKEPGK